MNSYETPSVVTYSEEEVSKMIKETRNVCHCNGGTNT